MYDRAIETRPVADQFGLDLETYRRQVQYLFEHSVFYRSKLRTVCTSLTGAANAESTPDRSG